MPVVSIPRMTTPWKAAAAVMAAFGFVNGYVGTAGAPYCGSMGQCLKVVADRGLAGFAPASLIPGAIGAVVFAAVVYVVFLLPYGVRKALHRQIPAHDGQSQSTPPTATIRDAPKQWPRPTPLLIAIGAGLAWAVLSVGPATLAEDAGRLIPSDIVTAPSCGAALVDGSECVDFAANPFPQQGISAVRSNPSCRGIVFVLPGGPVMEADGMCHKRSGGDPDYLIADVLSGGRAGLLAFLAVGAALLLWPRLRASSLSR